MEVVGVMGVVVADMGVVEVIITGDRERGNEVGDRERGNEVGDTVKVKGILIPLVSQGITIPRIVEIEEVEEGIGDSLSYTRIHRNYLVVVCCFDEFYT